ncbi:MAG TPA: efflux RND transporter periplasmic adaptor subunit [Spirochaetia bacterium]|nr:efflux RND transporter periplasmic adaptor subunit [Spirochaetia bacterium]
MRKFAGRIIGILLLVLFLATLAFLINKSRKPEVVYETEKPVIMDIVDKTVTTGSIVPQKEIAVKSRLSGIVNEVFVEPGDTVNIGDRIISIKVVPDNVTLNKAELDLRKAKLSLETAQRDWERQQGLRAGNFITDSDLEKSLLTYQLAKEDVEWAENNLLLLKEGASKRSDQVSNVIFSPSAGAVLEVPVKPGGSVIESNTFNDGTTIATVADMGHLMYDGQLDESEIGKVRAGMELIISVAALAEAKLPAHLDFIAPKGVVNQGAVQFEIKAYITPPPEMRLRAGYSASADIVLGRAEKALAVREQNILFEGEKTFVEVATGPKTFRKQEVRLGVSDGIHVQITSGLSSGEAIKIQTVSDKVRTPQS